MSIKLIHVSKQTIIVCDQCDHDIDALLSTAAPICDEDMETESWTSKYIGIVDFLGIGNIH